jgi:hypothetical protein
VNGAYNESELIMYNVFSNSTRIILVINQGQRTKNSKIPRCKTVPTSSTSITGQSR